MFIETKSSKLNYRNEGGEKKGDKGPVLRRVDLIKSWLNENTQKVSHFARSSHPF